MDYEIVTLEEKFAVGLSVRTCNTDPKLGQIIGGLWNRFYAEGVYESIPNKVDPRILGIYLEYAGDETMAYTAMAACAVTKFPEDGQYTLCKIPSGRYAKFVIKGDVSQAVAAAWQNIWQMKLPRSFQCDFEEYQDSGIADATIHIYVGLKEE